MSQDGYEYQSQDITHNPDPLEAPADTPTAADVADIETGGIGSDPVVAGNYEETAATASEDAEDEDAEDDD